MMKPSQSSAGRFQVKPKVPIGLTTSKSKQQSSSNAPPKKSKPTVSWLRRLLEFIFMLGWMACAAIAGYFMGHAPTSEICPPSIETTSIIAAAPPVIIPDSSQQPLSNSKCSDVKKPVGLAAGAVPRPDGFSYSEINQLWSCAKAEANPIEVNKKIYPKEQNYDKTKWKSILTVDPKAFFDKYLSQYPNDVRAVQPVVVFSHKPLENFSELPEVCKVLDVAIVPDTPGVCVAVTETYHDVASYHMLHADKQKDGTFLLTPNTNGGRSLPDEKAYSAARALLLDFFAHGEYVSNALKSAPQFGGSKVTLGSLVENLDEAALFKNSLAFATKAGVAKNKYCVFTTSSVVNDALRNLGVKVMYLPELASVGTTGEANVGYDMRRGFLQAWLAFAAANAKLYMMWQSPGTVIMEHPDKLIKMVPDVETVWTFKGRQDQRASPFFATMDLFVSKDEERPVHLLHEILLHFDLVLAWASMDAVVAYRLAENNSRYGTTTHMLPPHIALHTELLAHNGDKIVEALNSADKPKVIVVPSTGVEYTRIEAMLQKAGLWAVTK